MGSAADLSQFMLAPVTRVYSWIMLCRVLTSCLVRIMTYVVLICNASGVWASLNSSQVCVKENEKGIYDRSIQNGTKRASLSNGTMNWDISFDVAINVQSRLCVII